MEIYKPLPLALQDAFTVCGRQLHFSKGFDHYNAVRVAFNRRAYLAQAEMTECYEKQIHSIDQLLSTGVAVMERINRESAEFAVSVLMYYGIETVTPEKLVTLATCYTETARDGTRHDRTIYWESVFKKLIDSMLTPIQERVRAVKSFENELSLQRQMERAGRGRWVGGGFGFSGAVKGAMMAGMMNAGTGIFRGIGDSFINAADARRVQALKNAVVGGDMPLANFNYIVKTYVMHLYEVTKGYLCNTMGYYQPDEPGVIQYYVAKSDIENAVGKFSNYELFYKNGAKTADDVKAAIIEYMLVNIWDINALRSLYLLSPSAAERESILYLTPYLGLQYEFASIALNIDADSLEEAQAQNLPEAKLGRLRKEIQARAELIDFLISASDDELQSGLLRQKYINKNGVYLEKSNLDPSVGDFEQDDFKIARDDSLPPSLPFVLSRCGKPFSGKIKLYGYDFSYEGDFQDGKFSGHGRLEYKNGTTFEGDLVDGTWTSGTLCNDSYTYEGGFLFVGGKGHLRHGRGRTTLRSGDVIEGMYARGELSGYGKVTHKNGDVIEGRFAGAKPDGDVRITTKDYTNDCKFAGGCMVYAVIQYANGEAYSGEIHNPEGFGAYWAKAGNGTFRYANGEIYSGSWKDSKRHGTGTLTDQNGTILYSGEWVNDARKSGGLFTKFKDRHR